MVRGVIVAIPPEPVRAFRNQHLLPGARQGVGRHIGGAVERAPRVGKLTPRALIVAVTNPDIKVCIDP
jgi:hypothetical protein